MALRAAVAIGVYLAAGLGFLIAVNADQGNFAIPFFVVAGAAIVAGWIIGAAGLTWLWVGLVLPCVLVLLGLPFGDTNKNPGGDGVVPVALIAVTPAIVSMVLMPLVAGVRIIYDRNRDRLRRRAA